MLKFILLSCITVFIINMAYAQKSFDLTIKLDSSINPKNVQYQYYDGKDKTFLPDTFGNKRVVVLKGEYYSPSATFTISYLDAANNPYANVFFISDKPAVINFYFKANNDNKLNYNSIENAVPIYDSTANKSWGRLQAYMTDTSVTKENMAFDDFLQHNKAFGSSDSLTRIFNVFYKKRMNRIMSFLKKYPDDYFSFWYFKDQVAQPNSILRKDTAYLKEQLTYLKTVFPAKYTGSIAGKELIKTYETKTTPSPLKLNEPVPPFTITTIDGKKISLKDLKGKYVLLDFWATWCPPCMAELPFVKEIRKKYSPEKLVIIGISLDRDLNKMNEVIKQKEMNWLHFYDRNNEIGRLYRVDAIPVMVLIDKAGKLLYQSDHQTNDQDKLPQLLESAAL